MMIRNWRFYFTAALICIAGPKAGAQTYSTGEAIKVSEIDFTEFAEYYKEHPLPLKKRLPFDEDEESEPAEQPEPDASEVRMMNRPAAKLVNTGGPSFLPVSLSPADSFEATRSNGTNIPPDTHGDVDNVYLVAANNQNFRVTKKDGTLVSNLALDAFWSAGPSGPSVLPSGTDPFDPKIFYDPNYKRWVIVTDAVNQSTMGSSNLLIAVSKTCNPTGKWNRYVIAVDPSDNSWLDYPNLGFNSQWVVITGNLYANVSGGPHGGVVYAIDYAAMMAGTGAPFTKINQTSSFTLCPAATYDAGQLSSYLVEVSNGHTGKLRLWKIAGPVASPVMTSVGYPTSTTHWNGSGPSNGADFAPQVGTTNKLDAGDNRIHRMVMRNGKLWTAHSVYLPYPGAATRSSAMWWQMDTTGTPLQNGLLDESGSTPGFFMYPSINVNINDDALMGFSYSNSTIHPSAGYVMRMHTDPLDSMRSKVIYKSGQSTYYLTFGGSKNRWGDYSAACVDPADNLNFWTIEEASYSTANTWDTWWANVTPYPSSSIIHKSLDSVSISVFDTISYSGPIAGASIFTWSFSGGTATPGTGTGAQTVKWTSNGWKYITLIDSVPGCTITYTDSVYVRRQTGVSAQSLNAFDVRLAPNPNSGTFELVMSNHSSGTVGVRILNMEGRLVYANQFENNSGNIAIDAKDLAEGVYLVNIYVDGAMLTKKLTISK